MKTSARLRCLAALLAAPVLFAAEKPPAPAAGGVADSDYSLQPGDTVDVMVYGEEGLTKQMSSLKISPDHTIRVVFFEDKPIDTTDKTRRDLENIITSLYKPRYLKDPKIGVRIASYAPRKVNVVGAVNSPKEVQFPPEKGLKLIDAITQCGGPSRIADPKRVVLTRNLPGGKTEKHIIDIRPLMENRKGENEWPLQPDDTIFVPET